MNDSVDRNEARRPWLEPDIRELDIRATAQFPNRGADVGGNPYVDCQRS